MTMYRMTVISLIVLFMPAKVTLFCLVGLVITIINGICLKACRFLLAIYRVSLAYIYYLCTLKRTIGIIIEITE